MEPTTLELADAVVVTVWITRTSCGTGGSSPAVADKAARVMALLLNRVFVRSNAFGLVKTFHHSPATNIGQLLFGTGLQLYFGVIYFFEFVWYLVFRHFFDN